MQLTITNQTNQVIQVDEITQSNPIKPPIPTPKPNMVPGYSLCAVAWHLKKIYKITCFILYIVEHLKRMKVSLAINLYH